jgi:hypothetical protein
MEKPRLSPHQQVNTHDDEYGRPPQREEGAQARYPSKITQKEENSQDNKN